MMYVIHFSLPYSILATCNQRIKMELHQHPLWTSDPIPFTAVMSDKHSGGVHGSFIKHGYTKMISTSDVELQHHIPTSQRSPHFLEKNSSPTCDFLPSDKTPRNFHLHSWTSVCQALPFFHPLP